MLKMENYPKDERRKIKSKEQTSQVFKKGLRLSEVFYGGVGRQ